MKITRIISLSSLVVFPQALGLRLSRDTNTAPSVDRDISNASPRSIKFKTRRAQQYGTSLNVINAHNLEYLTNVTVDGQPFIVVVDTGSTDLWVHPRITDANETNNSLNLTYGLGSASGKIAYGNVAIGNYSIPNQVFLNVDKVEQQNGLGILGLGFDTQSRILNNLSKSDTSLNKAAYPPLTQIFNMDPSAPNFIGLLLERTNTTDESDPEGGTFTISEYDPNYKNIANTTQLPVAPSNSTRWTVAVDKVAVNGKTLPLNSSVDGAAANTSIALIDSGTTLAYIPAFLVDFIYGSIPGAVHYTKNGTDAWYIPCSSTANLSLSFGGQDFPIDPLDITNFQNVTQGGKEYTTCANAFVPQTISVGAGQLDFLLGSAFMRNVYSVFNFGNHTLGGNFTGTPSIQMLSITDQSKTFASFPAARSAALANLPPLIDPKDIK